MAAASRSPRVEALGWGRVEVEGGRVFKDAKLYPGGAREWDWSETGTRHRPGIQPADVEELLAHGARVVVLSQGVYRRLGVCPATIELLRRRGIGFEVLPTGDAVAAYNRLCDTEAAAALIHSTC